MKNFDYILCNFTFCVAAALCLFTLTACDNFLTKDVSLGAPRSTTTDTGDSTNTSTPNDSDDDGLSDDIEGSRNFNSVAADTDQDGFDDGLEFVGNNGDPLNAQFSPTSFNRVRIIPEGEIVQSDIDRDLDGLGDNFETSNSLDPENPDIDADGFQDGLELVANSDPFRASIVPVRASPPAPDGVDRTGTTGPPDTDRDGLSDQIEALNGTTIDTRDTDSDGFSDGIEFLMGSSGTDQRSVPNFNVPPRPDTIETAG